MIRRIQKRLSKELNQLKKYHRILRHSKGLQVRYFNFWNIHFMDNWFYHFLEQKGFLDRYSDLTFSFFSVYGPRYIINLDQADVKIFFNAENVFRKKNRYPRYRDLAINKVDLALGFRHLDHPKSLKFPLWLLHMFDPGSDEGMIRSSCEKFSFHQMDARNRFAVHVSSHDDSLGIRSNMIRSLSSIGKVDSAGSFMNNTDELKSVYGDNKVEFMRNYKFNLCPENSNNRHYVTEKISHSIMAGCIPVYWGACGEPEPEIFNLEAMITWEKDSPPMDHIRELNQSDQKFREIFEKPRLQPDAADHIVKMFRDLEVKLDSICRQKTK